MQLRPRSSYALQLGFDNVGEDFSFGLQEHVFICTLSEFLIEDIITPGAEALDMVFIRPIRRRVALKGDLLAKNAVSVRESLVGMGSFGVEAKVKKRFVRLIEDSCFAGVSVVVDYLIIIF
jgi:hypothetical protein